MIQISDSIFGHMTQQEKRVYMLLKAVIFYYHGLDEPEKRDLDPDKEYRVLICYNDTGLTGPGERIAGTPVPFRIAPAGEKAGLKKSE